jgi:hypothetical protein
MIARATLVVTLACALAACRVPIARFTVVGDPAATGAENATTTTPVTGTSCRWWIAGVHLGVPRMEEALAAALTRAGGGLLRDAELVSSHPVYGFVGRHCYELTGTPWNVEAR